MQLPRQSEDPVKPKKIRSTDDFGITGSTVYVSRSVWVSMFHVITRVRSLVSIDNKYFWLIDDKSS